MKREDEPELKGDCPAPRVAYIRDDAIGLADFSTYVAQHAMKPYRTIPTHALVDVLGLTREMVVVRPPLLPLSMLQDVHTADYVDGLQQCGQKTWEHFPMTPEKMEKLGVPLTPDCPLVEGLIDYSVGIASGTLCAARLLNEGKVDTAIHWAGGMHHARASECSGFCFINDINVGIMELLRHHERVLYIDLDVHHGDGVEEAFAWSDRVFTLSLHKFGESFFPGTGHISDIGFGKGRWYSLNLPLTDGVGDADYVDLFQFTLCQIQRAFRPDAVVVQCGADSLAGDRVGVLNLSNAGHARCVSLVKELGLPTMALGGGGYTMRNVARLWAYETAVLCGADVPLHTAVFGPDAAEKAADATGPTDAAAAPGTPTKTKSSSLSKRKPKRERSPSPKAMATPPPQIDELQRLAIATGASACADGVDDDAVVKAARDGLLVTLRSTFRPTDTLFVPPEASLVAKTSISVLMSKLRRLVAEHMAHVRPASREGGSAAPPLSMAAEDTFGVSSSIDASAPIARAAADRNSPTKRPVPAGVDEGEGGVEGSDRAGGSHPDDEDNDDDDEAEEPVVPVLFDSVFFAAGEASL